jgi:hypothetical protein
MTGEHPHRLSTVSGYPPDRIKDVVGVNIVTTRPDACAVRLAGNHAAISGAVDDDVLVSG